MKFISGKDRAQAALFPVSLEESVDQDNEVRLIDLFVNSLKLEDFGFKTHFPENGRPAYHPSILLKLFIYGYMNRIRSSRMPENECKRNIEFISPLESGCPDHNTIANFRKDNPKAIKKVFHQSVKLARHFQLIGGLLVAGDSTKLRAQNSKKNNFNQKKIQRHLEYIDKKLDQYQSELANEDEKRSEQDIRNDIEKHQKRKVSYQNIQKQLKETGNEQISTSDPDSRHQIVRNNITEVCYTAQTTVDAQNNIIIDYMLTNQNDKKAMGMMLQRAKTILRSNHFTALYDKGYHTGSEFSIAEKLGIKTLVAIPGIGRASQAPNPNYNAEKFLYDKINDSYTCPQGHKLISNGTLYKARNYTFKQYKTKACKQCPVMHQCTTAKANGKIIQRTQFAACIENNGKRVRQSEHIYKKRQAIVEHPFGTIKRQWGFDHILTKKGLNRASADAGLIFTAYNLRRIFNIIGKKAFIELISAFRIMFFTGNLLWRLFATSEWHFSTSKLFTMQKRYFYQNPYIYSLS